MPENQNQNQNHYHFYPDGLPMGPPEYVKVEKNSRGHNIEVKAATVEKAMELYDKALAEMKKREQ